MYRITGLPDRIKVGPYFYTMEAVPDLKDEDGDMLYGQFLCVDQRLRFQLDYACVAQAIDTVIHELLHCVYRAYRIPEEADEETVVENEAHGLTALLIDNPALLAWLNRAVAAARKQ